MGEANNREALNTQGRQIANRIAQAYPSLTHGIEFGDFAIDFESCEYLSGAAIAKTEYDGTRLSRIVLNHEAINDQYKRMDHGVEFTDIVRINTGIAVCLDLLFQQLLRSEGRTTNLVVEMDHWMSDPGRIIRALEQVSPPSVPFSHIKRAVEQISDNQDTGPERITRINAVRLAFGMTITAELMYGSLCGENIVRAILEDIQTEVNRTASMMAQLGYGLTQNMDTSLMAAADAVVDARDLALAIPASQEEIANFFVSLGRANRSPESLSESELHDLSGGYCE